MKTRISLLVILSLVLVSLSVGLSQAQGPAPQGMLGTVFTYQGQLRQGGLPVTGVCDFRFALWDDAFAGAQVGVTVDANAVAVTRGLFNVLLDFGPYAFNGSERWLAIDVRCPSGGGDFTPLTPRQELTPTPYAIYAATAPWSGLIGVPAGLNDGDDDTLAELMCAPGEVAKWNGTAWVCAPDDDSLASLSCASGQVAKWDRTAWVCAVDIDTDTDTLAGLACGAGEVAKWNGTAWACAPDNDTTYTAGPGLILLGTQFSVAFAGTGIADTAARSDHDHDARYVNEGQPNSITSAMIWDGAVTVWDLRDKAVTTPKLDDGAVTAAKIADGATLAEILDDDGAGSGLDADLLDGHHGGYYRDAGNINAGTLGTNYYSAYSDLGAEGYLDNNADSDILTRIQADGRYVAGGTAWLLSGNAGTTPATDFVGTTDNQALEFKVNGSRAFRLEPNATSPNVIGGSPANSVTVGAYGATIGGGGANGNTNRATDTYDTVGGGYNNQAGNNAGTAYDAHGATVGGGDSNTASGVVATVGGGYSQLASGWASTVAGGWDNTVSSDYTTVGGGRQNVANNQYATVGGGYSQSASGSSSTIAGGYDNTASNSYATVGGGSNNTASGGSTTVSGGSDNTANGGGATVGGGWNNTASNFYSTVGGGEANTASGEFATVPGGIFNTAIGNYSFAAGLRAKANHQGAFVWADSTDADFASSANNEFAVRAGGGVRLVAGDGGLRLEPDAISPNVIGGYSGNSVTSGAYGATIGGGGASGATNRVTDEYGTVGGGYSNRAGNNSGTTSDARFATVGGGYTNTASDSLATVGGGFVNTASGYASTIGGGIGNTASGDSATVGGGDANTASIYSTTVGGGQGNTASNTFATVGGGQGNTASSYYTTVGGGDYNTASGYIATVGGGRGNAASGQYATVPGGLSNIAQGDYSLAAGRRAKANHNGAFVWADSTDADFASERADQLRARANGGARFDVNSSSWVNIYNQSAHATTVLIDTSTGAYLTTGGTWTNASDRSLKENLSPVSGQDVLAKLAALPIFTWNYKAEKGAPHIGPVAQDFYAAFGLGGDDKAITTVDADGVALAAIQGLNERSQTLEAENAALRQQVSDLETRMAALEALVAQLAQK